MIYHHQTLFLCKLINALPQVKQRDVLQEGFGDELNGKADAVFLDLPSPWVGVAHAVLAMKEQGKFYYNSY